MRSQRLGKPTVGGQIEATTSKSELPSNIIKQLGQDLLLMDGRRARIDNQVNMLRRVQALMLEVGSVLDAVANTQSNLHE